jgi:phosphoenolpyruvate synthase/pyruvate phosphate dikinase
LNVAIEEKGWGEAVRRSFAGTTSERASAYHQRHGGGTARMSFLVQAMVDPMAAG